jgi:cation:H+ antiporter
VTDPLTLLLGLGLAAAGGELFVRGAVGLATWARVPPGIVGATVAAFATSSPELSVAVSAAAGGAPQIALGDALGSNVANLGLVLGLAALIAPVAVGAGAGRRDLPFAVAAPLLTLLLVLDGRLSRLDAAILAAAFAVWLALTVAAARRERGAARPVPGPGEPGGRSAVWASAVGLACLIVAGRLIVDAAGGIGDALGMDAFVVGATLVALGTSTPELATALVAGLRGHDDVGLGTLLGSCLFNGLFVVPVAATIAPIDVAVGEVATGLAFGLALVALTLPGRGGHLTRARGAVLVAAYAAYTTALVAFPPAV